MRLIDADKLLLHLADYQLQESPGWGANGYGNKDAYEAITHCIEAVEEAPTCMNCEKMHDDLISRQAAIDVLGWFSATDPLGHTPVQIVRALPTAEPRKGKWIKLYDEDGYPLGCNCSECEKSYVMPDGWANFCPNCGARM